MFTQRQFLSFEWDDAKRAANLQKHGIDFEDAVFALHQFHFEIPVNRHGEARTLAICSDIDRIITVVYTMRGEVCRIISARRAHRHEQRIYHQNHP